MTHLLSYCNIFGGCRYRFSLGDVRLGRLVMVGCRMHNDWWLSGLLVYHNQILLVGTLLVHGYLRVASAIVITKTKIVS